MNNEKEIIQKLDAILRRLDLIEEKFKNVAGGANFFDWTGIRETDIEKVKARRETLSMGRIIIIIAITALIIFLISIRYGHA